MTTNVCPSTFSKTAFFLFMLSMSVICLTYHSMHHNWSSDPESRLKIVFFETIYGYFLSDLLYLCFAFPIKNRWRGECDVVTTKIRNLEPIHRDDPELLLCRVRNSLWEIPVMLLQVQRMHYKKWLDPSKERRAKMLSMAIWTDLCISSAVPRGFGPWYRLYQLA